MSQSKTNKGVTLPPKPKEPEPYECCGRGCDPCIFDYYEKSLARWKKRIADLQNKDQE